MLTEAPRKGELWTVLVVRQYFDFLLEGEGQGEGSGSEEGTLREP